MPSKTKPALCPQQYSSEADSYCRLDPNQVDGDFWYYTRRWIKRARKAAKKKTDFRYFDAMIYLWVSFNAWLGETATNRDMAEKDRPLVKSAALDGALHTRFEDLKRDDRRFSQLVARFADLWPVFDTRELQELQLGRWEEHSILEKMSWSDVVASRRTYVQRCLAHVDATGRCAKRLGPWCFRTHCQATNGSGSPSADWAHTLAAIYQVRCNLFHGGKMAIYSGDRLFVELAYRALWEVWGKPNLVAAGGGDKSPGMAEHG